MTAPLRGVWPADLAAATLSGTLGQKSMKYLDQLARNEQWAAAAERTLEAQAVVAWTQERQRRVLARLVRRRTKAERREWRERVARQERQAARARAGLAGPAAAAVGSRRGPAVYWEQAGDGPALLLLNGWTAGGRVWPDAWLRTLQQHFRVIQLDTRGSGLSRTAPAPFTMGTLAKDARDVLKAAGAERATVLGLSMGGMIAQELALRDPRMVERLVLVATRPPAPAHLPAELDMTAGSLRRPREGQSLAEFYRALWAGYAAPGFPEREPALIEELISQIVERPTPRAGVTNQLWAIACWHGAKRLGSLTVPTVVVHGDSDPLSPVGNGMRLARLIPQARYVELAGIGHLVPLEAGDALVDVLLAGA